jgi:hypothetical protein
MKLPEGFKDWRTTTLGILQGLNAVIMAVQAFQAENQGLVFIEPHAWARFLLIGALLKTIQGFIIPSTAKVKEKTAEMIDQKLEAKVETTEAMVDRKIEEATK